MATTAAAQGANGAEKPASSVDGKIINGGFIPLVCVVDFHHARGPEVERWFGAPEGTDPAVDNDWSLLPFMALSDGAHASTEDFSYFTLLKPYSESAPATSLFGISCTRQMDASQLLNRPPEVTRSTVQKAVVVIADTPQFFGMLRERLSVVTSAWFAQREFADVEILRRFQESLADEKERGVLSEDDDRDQYLGMSLRELVREFKWQTLVLLKCCLLQPKFSLISLIPGLLRNLQDCAGPELNEYAKRLTRPTSLRTSDRNSLLSYMGLPLQIFAQGSLFGPYTPLQQLDILADFGTKSYIVGSTNSLLLQQRDRYSDILINLDDNTVNISSPSLKAALQLSVPDRRWIDFIAQEVNDTWDDANPGRPKTMGYRGSEEFIRLQFEEYLLSLISSVKYHTYLLAHAGNPKMALPHIEGDPSADFGHEFVDYWMRTENYRLWSANTDSHLFDIVEPKHPCAGGLTIDDVQRRISQQVQDLHLDERFAVGREALGRNIAAGREKASTMFNKLYADMEALRESQRRKAEEHQMEKEKQAAAAAAAAGGGTGMQHNNGNHHERNGSAFAAVDIGKAQQTVQSVGSRAGAYLGSWASWAGEKRKAAGWGRPASGASTPTTATSASGGGGWGFGVVGGGGGRNKRSTMSSTTTTETASDRDFMLASPRMSISSGVSEAGGGDRASRSPMMMRESFGGAAAGVDTAATTPQTARPLSGGEGGPASSPVGTATNSIDAALLAERNKNKPLPAAVEKPLPPVVEKELPLPGPADDDDQGKKAKEVGEDDKSHVPEKLPEEKAAVEQTTTTTTAVDVGSKENNSNSPPVEEHEQQQEAGTKEEEANERQEEEEHDDGLRKEKKRGEGGGEDAPKPAGSKVILRP